MYTGNDGDFTNNVNLFGLWPEGTELTDYFSGNTAVVSNNNADFNSPFGLLLIGEAPDSPAGGDPVSFTINAKRPNDWAQINAYLFNNKTNTVLAGTPAWPGQPMGSLAGSTVWNTLTVNVPNGVSADDVSVVFNNNNNGSQTVDLVRNRDGWFEFTSGGAVRNGVWSDTCPSDCPGGSNSFRIYSQKPSDWAQINAYIFNTTQNAALGGTANWPGQQMTKLAGTNNWYFYDIQIPPGVSNSEIGIVYNNNNNGSQSVDLLRDREGWFNFTSGGAVRTGSWSDTCPFDCPSATLTAAIDGFALPLEDTLTNRVIAYPNPSNGQGEIRIDLKKREKVSLRIYDLTGRKIQDVSYGELPAGTSTMPFTINSSGTYLYTLEMGGETKRGKLIVN